MPDKLKLKSCPFCGGQARITEWWPSWDTREYLAYCYDECGGQVRGPTEAEAIAVWNKRTPSATQALAAWEKSRG